MAEVVLLSDEDELFESDELVELESDELFESVELLVSDDEEVESEEELLDEDDLPLPLRLSVL